jgi:RimJ/RimL family protein N-acetyltransferase
MLEIKPLNKDHFNDLLPIVKDPEVMKHISRGDVWDDDHLNQLISDSIDHWRRFQKWVSNPSDDPDFHDYIWAIIANDKAIGVVSILYRKVSENGRPRKVYFIRIYIGSSYQGKGYGKKALIAAVNFFHTYNSDQPIYSYVHLDNDPSYQLMKSINLTVRRRINRLVRIKCGNLCYPVG